MSTRIQLRGISRTPSDKMTADGGLAESLNIRLDNEECAPMIPPKDITETIASFSEYGLPPASAGLVYDILYVHKQNNYRNIICSQSGVAGLKVGIWKYSEGVYSLDAFLTLTDSSESIKEVTAIGNTIIIYTNKLPYFAVYKENAYTLLGSRIPVPAIRIYGKSKGWSRSGIDAYCLGVNSAYTNADEGFYIQRLGYTSAQKTDTEILSLVSGAGAAIQSVSNTLLNDAIGKGRMYAPTFLRTAVRLFDGSYVNHSAPYCLGAGQTYSTDIWICEQHAQLDPDDPDYYYYYLCIRINPTAPKVFLNNTSDLEKWGDIIRSVDVFASSPVENPVIESQGTPTPVSGIGEAKVILTDVTREWDVEMQGQLLELSQIEELAVSRNVFRQVLIGSQNQSIYDEVFSTTWAEMSTGDGVVIPYPKQEQLELRDALPDDYDSNFITIAEDSTVFNQRLVLSGVRQLLSSGNTWFGAPVSAFYYDGNYTSYKFKYYVTASSGDSIDTILSSGDASSTIGKSYNGTDTFTPGTVVSPRIECCFGWMAYPHPNCKKMIIRATQNGTPGVKFIDVEMKQHPKLSCSYAFFGFGVELGSLDAMSDMNDTKFAQVNPYLSYLNKMFYSEVGNPFIFPVSNRHTFDDEVLACKVANRALSQGQFGQYPLYVFTKGGIYSMATTAVGTFASVAPLSRDVAFSAKAIQSIDRAVVFTTSKGVMLLSGSDVTCLSTEMNGRHYTIDGSVASLLRNDANFAPLLESLTDSTPFMSFMEDARYAFDYAGDRLLCFNPFKPYAYAYVQGSHTWHKINMRYGFYFDRILNSYPETMAAFTDGNDRWRVAQITNATKRNHVADCIKDNVDTEYSQQQIANILSGTYFDVYSDDITDAEDLAGGLSELEANYTILPQATHLLDFSTYLDTESTESLYGVMVTRPIDLSAPDVRKVINDIRLRGKYNAGDVKYLLLGSMDGQTFAVLNSLRGTSCKYFRLVILSSMEQAERLSYVEVEFQERFKDRLR